MKSVKNISEILFFTLNLYFSCFFSWRITQKHKILDWDTVHHIYIPLGDSSLPWWIYSAPWLKSYVYRLQTKLREGNVFTHVCLSTMAVVPVGTNPTWEQTPSWEQTPLGIDIPSPSHWKQHGTRWEVLVFSFTCSVSRVATCLLVESY